ncbi:MAG: dTDP-4-dehydrorhamnose reductase [Spirochaetia bacterium]|nr:dTDP-4-dehydrorhamnose reductase [Spirochaetia bacterium]
MVWVIGSGGMLGTEVCRQLDDSGIQYVKSGLDVDITDIGALRAFASRWSVDWIINCAAYTAVDKAESEAELCKKVNEDGVANIALVAQECGAALIHISTDYVFDGTGNIPYTEDMRLAPIGVYGKTKAAGEAAVIKNTKKFYILRTAWLYGWAGKNFVYTMIRAMNSRDSLKVVNDQKGTPTFAGDLARVILKIIDQKIDYGIYHCTDLGETTWWEFAREIQSQAISAGWLNENGKNCTVNPCSTEDYPTPAKRPAYSVLSKEKIQKALGFTLPQWQDSLKVFLNSDFFDKGMIL